MIAKKNISYYLITLGLFILLKYGYTLTDNNSLSFLIKPTDLLVGLLLNSTGVYSSDNGFYHPDLNFIIEKSCSGFNFLLLCFCMLTFLILKYVEKPLHKLFTIPVSIVLAYAFTIFVNASRIVASILIKSQLNNRLSTSQHLILHEAIGVLTNLSFLIIAYYLLDRFLNKYNHEKLATS